MHGVQVIEELLNMQKISGPIPTDKKSKRWDN